MIQFQGLHGVPLAAPQCLRLARDIGLEPRRSRVSAEVDPAALERRLSRNALRILHALSHRDHPVDMDTLLAAMRIAPPPRARASDCLSRMVHNGFARAIATTNGRSMWIITATGQARIERDAQTVSPEAACHAVAQINASPVFASQRWWPAETKAQLRRPATMTSVCEYLFASRSDAAQSAVAAALDQLAASGDLISAPWERRGRASTIYWTPDA
ncbi:hypothetical protein JI664_03640 [Rhodobacter sp. NTK016B]|uniref:hypothetical protein n=1 Tax=Rhodobacter sp. NTK016B TaxID=2759676 RepID=UPI001A8E7DF9|nr:hypothetical protein [Rhodobacter sp. NTK016B]MBN8291050.1 hypothetical protein [Rhodobacter sp. NTK016B]